MDQKLKKLEEIQELLARAWRMAYEIRDKDDFHSVMYRLTMTINSAEGTCYEARDYLKGEK